MHWCIGIDLIYIDLNVRKSLAKKERESNIVISNHIFWMKRTERIVEERRKCGKRQERAEVKAWHRFLQLLEMITQSYFPLYASLLKSCFSRSVSSDLSDQILGPCWRFPRLHVLLQSLQWQMLPLQDALLSHSQLTVLWCILEGCRRIMVGKCCETELSSVWCHKGTGFSSPCSTVPVHKPRESSSADTMSPSHIQGKKTSHSTGLHHFVLHHGASSLDDPTTDQLMAVSCRLTSSHM